MNDFNFIIPITKVDEEKRLVFGVVTEEIVDQAGEIMDYETCRPLFEDWSAQIAKATGGKSVGNMRLMHQPVIAGKLTTLDFDDEAKRISCCGRVVDDESWKLVLEGCLSGFSMGGKYIKRWKDPENKKVTRFTARPVEVSLVDNPCVTTATFEYLKADGSTEIRKFHSAGDGHKGDEVMEPTAEQIAEKAAELAKAAGTPEAVDAFMDEARDLLTKAEEGEEGEEEGEGEGQAAKEAGAGETAPTDARTDAERATAELEERRGEVAKTLVQVWQSPDGRTAVKKGDLVETIITAPVVESEALPEETPIEKALRLAREAAEVPGEPAPELEEFAAELDAAHKGLIAFEQNIAPDLVAKGLYELRNLASVMQEMSYLVTCTRDEAAREGDNSKVPEQIFGAIRQVGAALIAMAQEEVGEMLTLLGAGTSWADAAVPIDDDVIAIVELAAMADSVRKNTEIMEKAGARNNKSDAEKIQAMHDHSVDLGAKCAMPDKAAGADEPLDDKDAVIKALEADKEKLTGEVGKAVTGIAELGEKVRELTETVEKLRKSPGPLPARTDTTVVHRGGSTVDLVETLAKMSDDEKADLLIRASHRNPMEKLSG